MKTDFSYLIFTKLGLNLMDKPKDGFFIDTDVLVVKRKKQGSGSTMISVGIVVQTIIEW